MRRRNCANDAGLVALGQRLFEDQRLSSTGKVSCGTCHQSAKAFTDGRTVPTVISGRPGTRNVPSVANLKHVKDFFWEGRSSDLKRVVLEPFTNPVEHGLNNTDQLMTLVRADPEYVRAFGAALGVSAADLRPAHVGTALAAFVGAISADDSAFDRFHYQKRKDALAAPAQRGLELFQGRAGCAKCHTVGATEASFTDNDFHRLGIGGARIERKLPDLTRAARKLDREKLGHAILTDPDMAELGRYIATGKPGDIGKFRTPSLRNVALTAPYMHDGSIATLEEAIEFELYYRLQSDGRQILLTADEKKDLAEFLKSLTGDRFLVK